MGTPGGMISRTAAGISGSAVDMAQLCPRQGFRCFGYRGKGAGRDYLQEQGRLANGKFCSGQRSRCRGLPILEMQPAGLLRTVTRISKDEKAGSTHRLYHFPVRQSRLG